MGMELAKVELAEQTALDFNNDRNHTIHSKKIMTKDSKITLVMSCLCSTKKHDVLTQLHFTAS